MYLFPIKAAIRNGFFLVLCLSGTLHASAQVKIDKSIQQEVEKIIAGDSTLQIFLRNLQSLKINTVMIFSEWATDTLNDLDYEPINGISIHRIDSLGQPMEAVVVDETVWLPGILRWTNDTLFLEEKGVFPPFLKLRFSKKEVAGMVAANEVVVSLPEEPIRLKKTNTPLNIYEVVLSEKNLKAGITLYGYVDFMSEPFRQEDEASKTGYLMCRLKGKFYFKGQIE